MGVEYPVTGGHPIILYRGSQLSKSQTNSSLPGRIVLYINSSMSLKHPIFLCQGVFPNPEFAEHHELDCECSLLLNLNSCRYFRPQLFRRELQGTKEWRMNFWGKLETLLLFQTGGVLLHVKGRVSSEALECCSSAAKHWSIAIN